MWLSGCEPGFNRLGCVDTMRVATAYTGGFIDWRGIPFDGSHGTHASIAGEPLFINPDAPAWENPVKGGWQDERLMGRDGRRYGPLPGEWVRYLGRYRHGGQTIIHYQVGDARILGAARQRQAPEFDVG